MPFVKIAHAACRKLLVVLLALYFTGCPPIEREIPPSDIQKSWNYGFNSVTGDLMLTYYYWHDSLPETIPVTTDEPNTFLASLVHTSDGEKHFSRFVSTASYVLQAYGNLTSPSHGMDLIERNGEIYVSRVFNDSEASKEDIKRGYRFLKINGDDAESSVSGVAKELQSNSTNSIIFEKPDGTEITISDLGKSDFQVPFVLPIKDENNDLNVGKVINLPGKNVGYMNYRSFLSITDEEIIEAIRYFNDYDGGTGIDEFILDLRYNGGGYLTIAQTFMSAIVKKEYLDKEAFFLKYNPNYKEDMDIHSFLSGEKLSEKEIANLGLERVFILTTSFSASASELMISALTPYMDVQHIGTTTYGKPVGQNIFWDHEFYGQVFFLVTFAVFNKDAVVDEDLSDSRLYYDGIVPDYEVSEFKQETIGDKTLQVLKPFGSEEDPLVAAALHYIENGYYPSAPQSGSQAATAVDPIVNSMNYHTDITELKGLFRSPEDLQ